MRGLLKLTAIGNLGANPTLSTMPSGDTVANFSLAVNESYKDSSGAWSERTTWLKCHAFGDIADIIGRLCQNGTQVHVEGGFKTSNWVDNKNVEHSSFELRVQNIIVLNKGKTKEDNNAPQQQQQQSTSQQIAQQQQRNDVNATGGFVDDKS